MEYKKWQVYRNWKKDFYVVQDQPGSYYDSYFIAKTIDYLVNPEV